MSQKQNEKSRTRESKTDTYGMVRNGHGKVKQILMEWYGMAKTGSSMTCACKKKGLVFNNISKSLKIMSFTVW